MIMLETSSEAILLQTSILLAGFALKPFTVQMINQMRLF